MKLKARSNIVLIITIIVTILAIASPFIAGNINRHLSGVPEIIGGKGDFTNAKSNYTLYLTGEWEYYDGVHIISNRKQTDSVITEIPTPIVEPITSLSKANGFTASYKITVKNLSFICSIQLLSPLYSF